MESLFVVLILFVLLNSLLRLTFVKWWHSLLYAIVVALFIGSTWQLGTLQSKTQWLEWLYATETLQDLSVLVTFEALLHTAMYSRTSSPYSGHRFRNGMLNLSSTTRHYFYFQHYSTSSPSYFFTSQEPTSHSSHIARLGVY